MKTFKSPASRRLRFMVFAGSTLLFFSSCKKDYNNYNYNPPVGALSVIQASPDEAPLNFYLNSNLVNFQPLQFGDFTYYVRAFTGTRTANFDNAYTGGQLHSDTIHINQNQYYSLFLVNTNARPQYLYLTDTLKQPAADNANIRFLNLSPDAGNVDFTVQNATASVNNKNFEGYSGFLALTAGNYSLQVTQTGTGAVLATLSGVNFEGGGIYTIWLQGLKAGTTATDHLSINMMPNAMYN
jgi:hypothetical protein